MKSSIEIKKIAKKVVEIELETISQLVDNIDDNFVKAVQLIANSNGRLIVAGIGKSANISQKLVATFNSTGQPAVFLHASDAIHGDLGVIQKDDIVLCLSKSGNTPEIKYLVSNVKVMGNVIISISSNKSAFLSLQSDVNIDCTILKEACPHDLAPTSSTTAQLVLGDALAICLLEYRGFSKDDFAKYHPGGMLGKRLSLKVSDLLINNNVPFVKAEASFKEIIIEISKNRMGATAVIENEKLKGIITDGDLRRAIEKNSDFINTKAFEIMTANPKVINSNNLAYDAFIIMKQSNITQLVVLNNKNYVGIVHMHDIIKEGIVK